MTFAKTVAAIVIGAVITGILGILAFVFFVGVGMRAAERDVRDAERAVDYERCVDSYKPGGSRYRPGDAFDRPRRECESLR